MGITKGEQRRQNEVELDKFFFPSTPAQTIKHRLLAARMIK